MKPLNAKQLQQIESCRDHTTWTAEQCAAAYKFPLADVRRIYAEKRR